MLPDALWQLPILLLTGLAAGFVDSIAGGGGLITVPVLLNLGFPPDTALGTNKLQATFGSGSAAWHYGRAGLIDMQAVKTGIVSTALGAALGTLLVQRLDPEFLKAVIPWLLAAIALYLAVRPQLGCADGQPRVGPALFHVFFGLLLGGYDGFFGPGTGTFWAMGYVLLLGHNLTRATANTKLMNFTSNMVSLAVFAHGGNVVLVAGLTMGLGQWLGARLGARAVITRGVKLVRPVFLTVVLAMTGKLIWENWRQ